MAGIRGDLRFVPMVLLLVLLAPSAANLWVAWHVADLHPVPPSHEYPHERAEKSGVSSPEAGGRLAAFSLPAEQSRQEHHARDHHHGALPAAPEALRHQLETLPPPSARAASLALGLRQELAHPAGVALGGEPDRPSLSRLCILQI